jgi:RNA polymerase sigma factor (sigma-70 family)
MAETVQGGPHWPCLLKKHCCAFLSEGSPKERERALELAWLLLNSSISRYIRMHEASHGRISREDVEDLASEKSFDLIRRMELGEWDIRDRASAEIAACLSAVGRNALLDRLREANRRHRSVDPDGASVESGDAGMKCQSGDGAQPDLAIEQKEFAGALAGCAAALPERSRLVWFLRVFCGLSSKEIALHPDIRLQPGHVDVVLHRTREIMRTCMKKKGFDSHSIPAGSFVEIWKAIRYGNT